MNNQLNWKLLGLAGMMMLWPLFGVAQVNLDSGLVIYYPFNGDTIDASGNGIDGRLFGASFTEDRFGQPDQALAFDGIDDYLEVDSADMIDTILAPLSVSAWIKIDSFGRLDYAALISKSVPSALHFRFLLRGSNQLTIAPYPTCNTYNHQGQYGLNEWFFFSAVQDVDSIFMFINGILLDTFFCSSPLQPNSHPLLLGVDPHGVSEYFNGSVDEFRLYNRALSPEEVSSLFEGATSSIEHPKIFQMSLSPNPAPNAFTLRSPQAAIQSLALYDFTGRRLSAEISHDRHEAQVNSSYRGLALVKVQTDQGIWVQKVRME